MKKLTYILIGFLFFACTPKSEEYGKIIISNYLPIYEDDKNYFPHDYFVQIEMQEMIDETLSIKKTNNLLKIKNVFNDGLSGHSVDFNISKNLDIINVKYDKWTDVINGAETKYIVEKVIFSSVYILLVN